MKMRHTGHFEVLVGRYRLTWDDGDPDSYYAQRERAAIVDEMPHDEGGADRGVLSVALADGNWPPGTCTGTSCGPPSWNRPTTTRWWTTGSTSQ